MIYSVISDPILEFSNGVSLSSNVFGKIETNAKLSGITGAILIWPM